ncbi:Z1 domain-containing protein [Streptomyces sp. Je 1-369]|uniref:Z1 domain-containing protein n=1 Tax=Streptomyces sp. Je 1-369 TaxID=2966192 RepID=UPI0039E02942
MFDELPWLPSRHRSDHVPSRELPESLSSAMDAFILACSVRRPRGHGGAHNSMLVSVSRLVAVQTQVRELLAERVEAIVERFRNPGSPEARRIMARFEHGTRCPVTWPPQGARSWSPASAVAATAEPNVT